MDKLNTPFQAGLELALRNALLTHEIESVIAANVRTGWTPSPIEILLRKKVLDPWYDYGPKLIGFSTLSEVRLVYMIRELIVLNRDDVLKDLELKPSSNFAVSAYDELLLRSGLENCFTKRELIMHLASVAGICALSGEVGQVKDAASVVDILDDDEISKEFVRTMNDILNCPYPVSNQISLLKLEISLMSKFHLI